MNSVCTWRWRAFESMRKVGVKIKLLTNQNYFRRSRDSQELQKTIPAVAPKVSISYELPGTRLSLFRAFHAEYYLWRSDWLKMLGSVCCQQILNFRFLRTLLRLGKHATLQFDSCRRSNYVQRADGEHFARYVTTKEQGMAFNAFFKEISIVLPLSLSLSLSSPLHLSHPSFPLSLSLPLSPSLPPSLYRRWTPRKYSLIL